MADPRAAAHAQFLDAVACAQKGRFAQAIALIEAAQAQDPRPVYRFAHADFVDRIGRRDQALNMLAELLQADPGFAAAHARQGEILLALGRPAQALAALEAANRLRPGHIPTLCLLARALLASGDASAAEAVARKALEARPGDAEALEVHAFALRALGVHGRAETSLSLAARAAPADSRVWLSLANARLNIGAVPAALQAFERAESLDPPDAAQIGSARLLAMHYDDGVSLAALFEAHRQWARRYAPPGSNRPATRGGTRPLRIGYVSPRLHQCSAGVLFASVLENHDRNACEPYCYACSDIADGLTERMRASAARWCEAHALDDASLARRMREDGIDIAVDLAGHTPGHRLGAFARRPAPVCLTWLDYFDTTGVDAIDGIITDRWHSPRDGTQRFTEAQLSMPRLRYCWEPPASAPPVQRPPCASGQGFVFGSFNRFAKHSGSTLDLWCEVLRAVPSSRFVLKSGSLDHPEEHVHARRRFADRGIDPQRVECRGQSAHGEMLRQYGEIDLALDSFPYNGGIVTCEALWMGRPVLALQGDSMISRQSAAILACIGAEEWVARDREEFVAIAVRAAQDRDSHARTCLGLRERLAASPLVDARSFARDLEAVFQEAWGRFAGA